MFASLLGNYSSADNYNSPSKTSCYDVDYRHRFPAVRNQGDSGWCYAFTTADLISFQLGYTVSASDIALTSILGDIEDLSKNQNPLLKQYLLSHPNTIKDIEYSRGDEPANYELDNFLSMRGLLNIGGEESHALLMANTKGLCLEKEFNSDILTWKLKRFEDVRNLWTSQINNDPAWTEKINQIARIQDPLVNSQAFIILQYADQLCKNRIKISTALIPDYNSIAESFDDFRNRQNSGNQKLKFEQIKLWTKIDQKLNSGKPVAIGHNIFEVLKHDGSSEDGDHSSLIVARRLRNNSCEYFLRETWGPQCHLFLPQYQKKCEARAGGIWIRPDQIKSLYSVFSIN